MSLFFVYTLCDNLYEIINVKNYIYGDEGNNENKLFSKCIHGNVRHDSRGYVAEQYFSKLNLG